jgi:hypothetical protein
MLMTAMSMWWTVGWVVGAVVILLVAVLILAITALARRIDREAQQLVTDLDSIATKTRPLQDVSRTNIAVRTIIRGLRVARGETARAPDPYSTSPGWRE